MHNMCASMYKQHVGYTCKHICADMPELMFAGVCGCLFFPLLNRTGCTNHKPGVRNAIRKPK